MATAFAIHEDEMLKENHGMPRALLETKQKQQLQQQLQQQPAVKRTTFGVLNNVQLGTRAHAQKTVLQPANGKVAAAAPAPKPAAANDENDMQQILLAAKKAVAQQAQKLSVPVDAFKAFCVYEDENQLPEGDVSLEVVDQKSLNISETRNPLSEIKDVHLETPMSVGEYLASPMSVDKSLLDSSLVIATADTTLDQQLAAMRSEQERFFNVVEYQADILDYLKEAELKHLPKFGYMRKQPDINHSMRTILVDWLVEVCEEYRLQSETLCLAVSYIDRFLSTMSVVRAKLQLVGTAAMFIAAKYEEIYPPEVGEFVYITDHTYTKKQVLRMEQLILKVLTFDLFVPTAATFVSLYVTMNDMEERIKLLATYFCELSLLEADPYLQYVPSRTAAAALALARHTVGMPVWTKSLERQTGYTLDQLKEVLFHLARTQAAAAGCAQQAIQDKYKSNKYLEVGTLAAETPFDEEAYKHAVIFVSHDTDDTEAPAVQRTANDSVHHMINSLMCS